MKKELYIFLTLIIIGLLYLKWQAGNQVQTYIPDPSSPSSSVITSPAPSIDPTVEASAASSSATPSPKATLRPGNSPEVSSE